MSETSVGQANLDNINTGIASGLGEEITDALNIETQVYGPSVEATLQHAMIVLVDTEIKIEEIKGQMLYVEIEKGQAVVVPINTNYEDAMKRRGSEKKTYEINDPAFPQNMIDDISELRDEVQRVVI